MGSDPRLPSQSHAWPCSRPQTLQSSVSQPPYFCRDLPSVNLPRDSIFETDVTSLNPWINKGLTLSKTARIFWRTVSLCGSSLKWAIAAKNPGSRAGNTEPKWRLKHCKSVWAPWIPECQWNGFCIVWNKVCTLHFFSAWPQSRLAPITVTTLFSEHDGGTQLATYKVLGAGLDAQAVHFPAPLLLGVRNRWTAAWESVLDVGPTGSKALGTWLHGPCEGNRFPTFEQVDWAPLPLSHPNSGSTLCPPGSPCSKSFLSPAPETLDAPTRGAGTVLGPTWIVSPSRLHLWHSHMTSTSVGGFHRVEGCGLAQAFLSRSPAGGGQELLVSCGPLKFSSGLQLT